jgi:hypothetical protein
MATFKSLFLNGQQVAKPVRADRIGEPSDASWTEGEMADSAFGNADRVQWQKLGYGSGKDIPAS